MYSILYEKNVFKDLDKLPDQDVLRIRAVFKALAANPFQQGCKKLSGKHNLHRVRQGDYRIIFSVAFKEREIRVLLVAHRKDVYREI